MLMRSSLQCTSPSRPSPPELLTSAFQLFNESPSRGGSGFDDAACTLNGISLGGGKHLANLGWLRTAKRLSIRANGCQARYYYAASLFSSLSFCYGGLISSALLSEEGAHLLVATSNHVLTSLCREMQLFLIGYILISICEIFTVGWFPLNGRVRRVRFTNPQDARRVG